MPKEYGRVAAAVFPFPSRPLYFSHTSHLKPSQKPVAAENWFDVFLRRTPNQAE
jgi:hypothetical protein